MRIRVCRLLISFPFLSLEAKLTIMALLICYQSQVSLRLPNCSLKQIQGAAYVPIQFSLSHGNGLRSRDPFQQTTPGIRMPASQNLSHYTKTFFLEILMEMQSLFTIDITYIFLLLAYFNSICNRLMENALEQKRELNYNVSSFIDQLFEFLKVT